jgi:hypothetical protein
LANSEDISENFIKELSPIDPYNNMKNLLNKEIKKKSPQISLAEKNNYLESARNLTPTNKKTLDSPKNN